MQKIQWNEIDEVLLAKSLILIIIFSILSTSIINLYFNWYTQHWYLYFINTFLWVVGWVSLIVYLIYYKHEGWLSFMFTAIPAFTMAFMTISALVFMPILFYQNTDNSINDTTVTDNNIDDSNNTTESTFEDYIYENIKGIIYLEYAGSTWNPHKIKEKFTFFIFNNGTQNIDEDLQLSLIFPYDMNFSLSKPDNNNFLSYDSNETKPWVFGIDKITNVRWNKSLPGTTLSNKGAKWAIIYLETPSNITIFLDYRQSITYSAIINDIYTISVKKMPIFVEPPSEHPQDWDISKLLQDIEMYG